MSEIHEKLITYISNTYTSESVSDYAIVIF